jgi:hypothetical protein
MMPATKKSPIRQGTHPAVLRCHACTASIINTVLRGQVISEPKIFSLRPAAPRTSLPAAATP